MCFNNCLIAACVCVLRIDLNLCGRLRVGNTFFASQYTPRSVFTLINAFNELLISVLF